MSMLLASIWSGPDLLIIGAIMLLLFGNRLPTMMRSLGEGVSEFKNGINGVPKADDEPRANLDHHVDQDQTGQPVNHA